MGETGLVTARDADMLTVQLTRTEACASCRACTMGMQQEEMLLRARNECNADVGDTVAVALREGAFFRAMAVMYMIPFGLLLAGFAAGYALCLGLGQILPLPTHARELVSFITGILCMLSGYWLIRKHEPRFKRGQFTPCAVAIVADSPSDIAAQ